MSKELTLADLTSQEKVLFDYELNFQKNTCKQSDEMATKFAFRKIENVRRAKKSVERSGFTF